MDSTKSPWSGIGIHPLGAGPRRFPERQFPEYSRDCGKLGLVRSGKRRRPNKKL